MKVLLTSVFGPYGVDDAYGRKENIMELFHNQVTREQGLFSLRFNHPSFGLHLIADNLDAPTVVLDFPSEQRFIREIRKGYDFVGISFIVPNFIKAKRMAELIRQHAPKSQIVLGGHGTNIPDLEKMIEHDHICRGEGVHFMRQLLEEQPSRPISHPSVQSGVSKRVMGVPLASDAAVLMPGVGCPNACRFCATSHFFDRTYTPFLKDGQAVFDACLKMERELGVGEFFVMDENFLKYPERARELLDLMQRHDKPWRFGIFSSAETINAVGVEFLARLGVYFLWIGVESKTEVYAKNRGIDLRALIRSLRDHGITVLASGILFLEHHTKETIWEDIEYLVGLESDFVQFMQLGPMPQTALYRDYDAKGLLRKDLPYEEWHGQHRLWFSHPHFTGAESERFLRDAFRFDYDTQGASLLRMCDTALRGYETLAKYDGPLMRQRREAMRRSAEHLRPALRVLRRFGHNAHVRQLADRVIARYDAVLGGRTLRLRAREIAALAYATREVVRVETGRTCYQPKTRVTRYRASARSPVALEWGARPESALRPVSP